MFFKLWLAMLVLKCSKLVWIHFGNGWDFIANNSELVIIMVLGSKGIVMWWFLKVVVFFRHLRFMKLKQTNYIKSIKHMIVVLIDWVGCIIMDKVVKDYQFYELVSRDVSHFSCWIPKCNGCLGLGSNVIFKGFLAFFGKYGWCLLCVLISCTIYSLHPYYTFYHLSKLKHQRMRLVRFMDFDFAFRWDLGSRFWDQDVGLEEWIDQ